MTKVIYILSQHISYVATGTLMSINLCI